MSTETTLRPMTKGMSGASRVLISKSPPLTVGEEFVLPRISLTCCSIAGSINYSILPRRCDGYTPYGMLVSDKQ